MAALLESNQDFFSCTKNLIKIECLLPYFKRFNFYSTLKFTYKRLFNNFQEFLDQSIENWLKNIDFIKIGQSFQINKEFEIFDNLLSYRKQILSKDFLRISYASRRLLLENRVSEVIDQKRKNIFEECQDIVNHKDNKNESVVFFSIGLILLSNVIMEFYPNCNSFHGEIFDLIENINFDDIFILIPLKQISTILKIDSDRLDSIIERFVFEYFEREISKENFIKNLRKFADRSLRFLKEISELSNELDELLAKKVDNLLSEHFERFKGDSEEFTQFQDDIFSIIDFMRESNIFYRNFEFAVEEKIKRKNSAFINAKYNDIVHQINSSESTKDIVNRIISLKKFMNDECRKEVVVKLLKHVDDLNVNQNEEDKSIFLDTIRRNFPNAEMNKKIV